MTDIQTLIIFLAKNLLNLIAQDYILYINNLFINDLLAKILSQLNIKIMSTIWVKALELSLIIRQLKQVKESLKWEYLKIIIINNILYFLWQDNNWILSIITVYNLIDMIIWSHKWSSSISTSVAITWSVFKNLSVKDLSISAVINAYNYYMSNIDTANWY